MGGPCSMRVGRMLQLSLVVGVGVPAAISSKVVPQWPPTYNMSMSTIIMPCNTSGWFDAAFAARYGIADIDWSNGRAQWSRSTPMDDDSRLATQAAMIKAINPNTRVWIYRNLVKALSWYGAVREKLEDPQYSGWFLHFNNPNPNNYSVPRGNTSLYHSQDQTPTLAECGGTKCDCGSVPCGEYLWDPRNASLRHWLINTHILGPTGLGNPNVSGFYFDDCWNCESYTLIPTDRRLAGWDTAPTKPNGTSLIGQYGPSEIEHHSITDMGLSFADDMEIAHAWQSLMQEVYTAVQSHGGWAWPMFGGSAIHRATCAADLRRACKQENGPIAYMFETGDNGPSNLTQPQVDIANFLLVRGPYAWIGTGWVGCTPSTGPEGSGVNQTYVRPAGVDIDYGSPVGLCKESAPNVFTREYTKATVSMDCTQWKPTIRMK